MIVKVGWPHVTLLLGISLLIGPTLFGVEPALAHRDDYLDETFVYQTLDGGEFELETWGEVRSPRDSSAPNQDWLTLAFESGITSRWTVDGAAQSVFSKGRGLRFGRMRFETRYRFREEGAALVDIAASAEYELETNAATGERTEQTFTPRLVLSKDLLSDVNTTLNLDLPIRLSGGDPAFAYSLAGRYPAETLLRVGLEMKGQPSAQTATLFPQIWIALPRKLTVKLGSGLGLTTRTDPLVYRLVFEAEF